MNQRIAHIALVVDDYDEAIAFYTQKLGFQLLEDTPLSETKRWVMVAPKGARRMLPFARQRGGGGTAEPHRQPDRRAGLFIPAHRRFLAGLSALPKSGHSVCAGPCRGNIRHGGRV
jgi:catechol 2,3-dioxygenase-like lactoylglutathione lyase family enzyme